MPAAFHSASGTQYRPLTGKRVAGPVPAPDQIVPGSSARSPNFNQRTPPWVAPRTNEGSCGVAAPGVAGTVPGLQALLRLGIYWAQGGHHGMTKRRTLKIGLCPEIQ